MSTEQKAVPVAQEVDAPYWEGAGEHKLILPRCSKCGLYSARKRVICPKCQGETFEWVEVSGLGKIHSYTIVWQSTISGFGDEVPYVVCHAYIDEEPTCYISTNLLGVDESDFERLNVEIPVVMTYEKRGDAVIPQWRLA